MSDPTDEASDQVLRERLRPATTPDRPLDRHPVDSVRGRVGQRRSRRRRATAVGAAAVLLTAAGIVAVVDRSDDHESVDVVSPSTEEQTDPSATTTATTTTTTVTTTVTTAPPSTTSTTVTEPAKPPAPGGPPLAVRGDVAMAWTGSEVVVWGGDVEAFNMGLPGGDRSFADGAAYDPATGVWRPISPSPLPATAETPVAAMTDRGVVLVRGTATAIWDPDTDTWRSLDDAPEPEAPEGGGSPQVSDLVGDGERVISHSANAVLDVEAGTWVMLPEPPVRLERPTTAWTGRELIVVGGPNTPFTAAEAIAVDPDEGSWRTLPAPPPELHAEALSAAWDGDRVVVVNYDMTAATYDPGADAWTRLPDVPARFYEWSPQTFAAGGTTAALMAQAIAILDDDRWEAVPYDSFPLGFTVPLGDGSARVATWSTDAATEANALTVLDLATLLTSNSRRQIGTGSVDLDPGDEVTDASYDDNGGLAGTVRLAIVTASGATCTVTSTYLGSVGPAIDQPVREELPGEGGSRSWFHDEEGRVWETEATTSDLFRISCDQAADGRRLATTARFP